MAIDQSVPRSRRALLAAGLGGLGASILHVLGRPALVSAANGDPILAGQTTTATAVTSLEQTAAGQNGLAVAIAVNGSSGVALVAAASDATAVRGTNSSSEPTVRAINTGALSAGPAIFASTGSSGTVPTPHVGAAIHAVQTDNVSGRTGVLAESGNNGTGVFGQGGSAGIVGSSSNIGVDASGAVIGLRASNASNGTAVLAVSGPDSVSPAAKIGVYGYANQDANARAIHGRSPLGTAISGSSDSGRAVRGVSLTGTAIQGLSTSGTGVSSSSQSGKAHYASNTAAGQPAILAQNTGGASAIEGYTGSGTPPAPEPQTGVHGISNMSTEANGVLGRSTAGAGVWGNTDTGVGVVATGTQVDSWGLYASGGIAMVVDGPTFFSESGKTTIASGSSATVAVPSGIGADSIGFAMLMTNRPGIWVRAVTTSAANGTITIYLNTNVPGSTTLGWYLIN